MLYNHTAAALPRATRSHDLHAPSAISKPGKAKLSAVPGFKPEASCLTEAEIRHIVQDILG